MGSGTSTTRIQVHFAEPLAEEAWAKRTCVRMTNGNSSPPNPAVAFAQFRALKGPEKEYCPVCGLEWLGNSTREGDRVCFSTTATAAGLGDLHTARGSSGPMHFCGAIWHKCPKAPNMGFGAGVRVGIHARACQFCVGSSGYDEEYIQRAMILRALNIMPNTLPEEVAEVKDFVSKLTSDKWRNFK